MPKVKALAGGEAVAEAMRQINPDVVASYPITPQTIIMQKFADFHADGRACFHPVSLYESYSTQVEEAKVSNKIIVL